MKNRKKYQVQVFHIDKAIIFIILCVFFNSCAAVIYGGWAVQSHGVETYTNGQKIDNGDKKIKTDSILVFGVNDKLPDSAIFIANTEMHSAAFLKMEERYACKCQSN